MQDVPAQEEMQREVAEQFQLLADDRWHTVDAAQSIEQVEAEVRTHPPTHSLHLFTNIPQEPPVQRQTIPLLDVQSLDNILTFASGAANCRRCGRMLFRRSAAQSAMGR